MLRNYDPAANIVSFLGNIFTAFGTDNAIQASFSEDLWLPAVGISGETARSRNHNESGTVTLTLLATSPENDILSNAVALDKVTATAIGPLFIKEKNGTTVLHAPEAYIQKMPDMERAKEVGTVPWVIFCPRMELHLGGTVF
jgi:hypothetical protein